MGNNETLVNSLCHCGNPRAQSSRYCRDCKNAYMRQWRKAHPLTPEQRRRMNCHSYAHSYSRRGRLKKRPCGFCGHPAEMHHENYSEPLRVIWLCRKHHLALHRVMCPVPGPRKKPLAKPRRLSAHEQLERQEIARLIAALEQPWNLAVSCE